jgi:hypothetical protein
MTLKEYDLIQSFMQEHSTLAISRRSLIFEINYVLKEIKDIKFKIRMINRMKFNKEIPNLDPLDLAIGTNNLKIELKKLNSRRLKIENAIRHVRDAIKYTNTNMNFVRANASKS